jgi:integrase
MDLKKRASNGVWYVHYRDAAGDRQRTSCETKDYTLAQLKAAEIVREALMDAAPADVRQKAADQLTVGDLLRTCWNGHWSTQKSSSETKTRVFRLVRDIGHWPLSMVTFARVEATLNAMTSKGASVLLSNATKNRYVSILSKAFDYARERNDALPMPKFPSWEEDNIKERFVSRAEEATIETWFKENTAPADGQRQYLWDLFVVLIDSGMRCAEATEKMSPQTLVRSTNGTLRVHLQHGTTKSKKPRMVPLTKRAEAAALRMVASPWHGRTSSSNLGKQWANVMEKLGPSYADVTLHILRHTCASRLMGGKVPDGKGGFVKMREWDVAKWLGHSNLKTTERYAHLADDALDDGLSVLETDPQAVVPSDPAPVPALEAHPLASGTAERPKLYAIK